MNINKYFQLIDGKVDECYEVAEKARSKGLDPVSKVEVPKASSLAERVVNVVSVLYPQVVDKRIVNRILELEKKYGSLDPRVALSIAEEIAKEKYCKFENHIQSVEAGIRIALGYLTMGVVSSPIEGFVKVIIGKTKEGKDYFVPYFAGPMRSAGGTEEAFSLIIIDYLREVFGYCKYDPTEDEIKRGVHECYEFHERVNNLQYLPSEEELGFLMKNIPVQVAADPSEKREVYNFKDLERVDTNFIRSGFALVMCEGIAQKAPKILKRVKKLQESGFKLSGWNWLEEFVKLQKKIKEKKEDGEISGATYIQDIVAGRPVFSHPSFSGGFRVRYGRCRNTGYSALALNPGTMGITDDFIAVGTQLKIEKPTKGCTIAPCDEIDGPIVKLKDGSVRKINKYQESIEVRKKVDEIIYLGDILIPYGDFINRNHLLTKPGYFEEYWKEEVKRKNFDLKKEEIDFDKAVEISKEIGVSLHPNFIYYWSQIGYDEFLSLIDWVAHGILKDRKLILPYGKTDRERFVKGKRALELIGCEHKVSIENVVLGKDEGVSLLANLGADVNSEKLEDAIDKTIEKIPKEGVQNVLDLVNFLSDFEIRDKAGTFIGARMGKPEKAKLRKLTGSPHAIFPVGSEGGRLRSVQAAIDIGSVRSDFPVYYCSECKIESIYPSCEQCSSLNKKMKYCRECDQNSISRCEQHDKGTGYSNRRIDIKKYFDSAKKRVGLRIEEIPVVVKGVRGTSSEDHSCENLAKGLLRAKYNLNVNKDGTVRYDIQEMPLTHFKPKEVGTSVEKLIELGYARDIYGKKLENEDQLLEIFPHDIVLPACPETLDEKANDVFLNITNFVDDELEKMYGLERFFNFKNKNELAGVLVACIAPHNCASVVGRVIGFSKIQALLASPYIHAAMRRDCLSYNNYVPIKENGFWKIEKIGDYIERKKPVNLIDSNNTLIKCVSNIKIWSNPGQKQIIDVTKHQPRKLLKIFLEDGREIETTEDHGMYLKGKEKKKAHELKEGDKLMVSYKKNIEERDIEELFLPEIFKGRNDIMLRGIRGYLEKFEKVSKHENYSFRDSFPIKLIEEILREHGKTLRDLPSTTKIAVKRDNVALPIRVKLDERFSEVIGVYVAEGHLRKNDSEKGFYQLLIAGNEKMKGFVKDVFHSSFELKPSYENEDQLVFSSRLIYELFKNYLVTGIGAKSKRIPYMFFSLPKKKLAAFLRGYYEGDGSVSKSDIRVACDTVSEGLKFDLSFALSRFGIFSKFNEYVTEPGSVVKEFYLRKNREIPKFKVTKITIPSNFVKIYQKEIGFLFERKNKILDEICLRNPIGMRIDFDEDYVYPKVKKIKEIKEEYSYCFNVAKEHNFFANDILVKNCDGDESAVMLLMDMLLNFSKKFLPSHRGGTQDSPLVLNTRMRAGEVDDMVFDVDVTKKIPLELYKAAEKEEHPSKVKMETIKNRLGGDKEFSEINFSFNTGDINEAPRCSSYKTIPTMKEKVEKQMEICKKIRAVDTTDVARLIIERHFIRDIKGNLRKFSMQVFRCVGCNEKFRRPPLIGKCTRCKGKIIFTISEGSIVKYLQAALDLAETYGVSPYLKDSLKLVERDIYGIFGRDAEKQEPLNKWF